MLKFKRNIIIILSLIFLVGCSSSNVAIISPTTPEIIEYNDMSIEDLCDFLASFTEKVYAPKSQEDIDVAVGNAIGIIDTTAIFHLLLALPKEIDQNKFVEITHISYGISDGASDFTSNIIITFDLYSSKNFSTQKYVRFDLNDDNIITKIKEYSSDFNKS